ncbi:unnamed protein product [Didymodactylos carnosus]|uniref:Nucleoporin Nup188 N-terminal domain-containing protein n=1 Tax=Didymodactylos carnosus TaxID=1234261 RepID=A0A813V061_9BILA|nr:unnamed protein product [Didymodactylos carnosus]CAF3620368.1 unnamed protein product [Didymodactylos carnosus]
MSIQDLYKSVLLESDNDIKVKKIDNFQDKTIFENVLDWFHPIRSPAGSWLKQNSSNFSEKFRSFLQNLSNALNIDEAQLFKLLEFFSTNNYSTLENIDIMLSSPDNMNETNQQFVVQFIQYYYNERYALLSIVHDILTSENIKKAKSWFGSEIELCKKMLTQFSVLTNVSCPSWNSMYSPLTADMLRTIWTNAHDNEMRLLLECALIIIDRCNNESPQILLKYFELFQFDKFNSIRIYFQPDMALNQKHKILNTLLVYILISGMKLSRFNIIEENNFPLQEHPVFHDIQVFQTLNTNFSTLFNVKNCSTAQLAWATLLYKYDSEDRQIQKFAAAAKRDNVFDHLSSRIDLFKSIQSLASNIIYRVTFDLIDLFSSIFDYEKFVSRDQLISIVKKCMNDKTVVENILKKSGHVLFDHISSVENYFPLSLESCLDLYTLIMKANSNKANSIIIYLCERDQFVESVQMFKDADIALVGTDDECIAVANIYPYGPGKLYFFIIYYTKFIKLKQ